MVRRLLLLLMLCSAQGHGALYQCKMNSGEVEFTDTPCGQDRQQLTLQARVDERGFLTKYFKHPGNSGAARCSKLYCSCGQQELKLNSNIIKQLTHSAHQLRSQYKNIKANKKRQQSNTAQYCTMKMHQTIFNRLYPLVLKKRVNFYRVGRAQGLLLVERCGAEPDANAQGGWTTDRKYIDWYQCQERHGKQGKTALAQSQREQRRLFERLDHALEGLRN